MLLLGRALGQGHQNSVCHLMHGHLPRNALKHVIGHMLKHILRHVFKHVTGHLPRHVLLQMFKYVHDRHVPDHVLAHMLEQLTQNKLLEPPSA